MPARRRTGPADRPFPPYDGARYDVSRSVGWQVYNLTQLMRREIEARMAALDLTDAQWRPLWVLAWTTLPPLLLMCSLPRRLPQAL